MTTAAVCALQTMPTDMRALQDFEEEDKLQIKMSDVITIIEGRSVFLQVLDSRKFLRSRQDYNQMTVSYLFPCFHVGVFAGQSTTGGEVRTGGRCTSVSFLVTW